MAHRRSTRLQTVCLRLLTVLLVTFPNWGNAGVVSSPFSPPSASESNSDSSEVSSGPEHPDSPSSPSSEAADLAVKLGQLKDIHNDAKRFSKFVRIGRSNNFLRIGRASSFVRIGKDGNDWSNEGEGSTYHARYPLGGMDKRQMHRFIRIGRGNVDSDSDAYHGYYADVDGDGMMGDGDNEKRASSFVRIGRSPSSFVRIGRSDIPVTNQLDDLSDAMKRSSQFVRIGREPSNFVRIGKSPSNFVRIGKSPSNFVRIGKSPSNFVRIGKSDVDIDELADKRAGNFVRIGKSDMPETDKRSGHFVRIGKSADDFLSDQIKRSSDYLSDLNDQYALKRASSFVRIGKAADDKRASSFVRIGKSLSGDGSDSVNDADGADDKRASSFVRIGKDKAGPTESGFASGSIESPADGNSRNDLEPISVANRGSAFVRIGKIPSSAFVRIGKNDVVVEPNQYRYSFSRGSRAGHSSFVRIGK